MIENGPTAKVLVAGAGTMGTQIAALAAARGYEVALYDPSRQALERARGRLAEHFSGIAAVGLVDKSATAGILDSMLLTDNPKAAAAGVSILSESIPERPGLKRDFYREFGRLCPPDAIFATNSSTMLPSRLAAATGRPGRFAALHFHAPIWEARVVDVMGHPGTARETIDRLDAFARDLGQRPVRIAKEHAGYVFNSIYILYNHSALELAERGVASIEDIDASWKTVMRGFGPFEYMDVVGLDTVLDILELWARRFWFIPQIRRNAAFVRSYVMRGRLGVKSGGGFYDAPPRD